MMSMGWQKTGVDNITGSLALLGTQPLVYAYRFDYGAYNPEGYNAWPTNWEGVNYALRSGACHMLEISFFWGRFSDFFGRGKIIFREDNKKGREDLSAVMIKYVSQFARTGHPGEAGGCKWEPWTNAEGGPKRITLDADDDKAILKMSDK